jgi:hypothetical protein
VISHYTKSYNDQNNDLFLCFEQWLSSINVVIQNLSHSHLYMIIILPITNFDTERPLRRIFGSKGGETVGVRRELHMRTL